MKNNVRRLRLARNLSKAELARRAGVSSLTVGRIEKEMPCQTATRRKVLWVWGSNFPKGTKSLTISRVAQIVACPDGYDPSSLTYLVRDWCSWVCAAFAIVYAHGGGLDAYGCHNDAEKKPNGNRAN